MAKRKKRKRRGTNEGHDKLLADCAQAGKIPAEDVDTFYEIIEMLIRRKHGSGIR